MAKKLDLPHPNTLLPKTFDIIPEDTKLSERPTLI